MTDNETNRVGRDYYGPNYGNANYGGGGTFYIGGDTGTTVTIHRLIDAARQQVQQSTDPRALELSDELGDLDRDVRAGDRPERIQRRMQRIAMLGEALNLGVTVTKIAESVKGLIS